MLELYNSFCTYISTNSSLMNACHIIWRKMFKSNAIMAEKRSFLHKIYYNIGCMRLMQPNISCFFSQIISLMYKKCQLAPLTPLERTYMSKRSIMQQVQMEKKRRDVIVKGNTGQQATPCNHCQYKRPASENGWPRDRF
jgi:hypothetical protein